MNDSTTTVAEFDDEDDAASSSVSLTAGSLSGGGWLPYPTTRRLSSSLFDDDASSGTGSDTAMSAGCLLSPSSSTHLQSDQAVDDLLLAEKVAMKQRSRGKKKVKHSVPEGFVFLWVRYPVLVRLFVILFCDISYFNFICDIISALFCDISYFNFIDIIVILY
jgi:hypothetical protein